MTKSLESCEAGNTLLCWGETGWRLRLFNTAFREASEMASERPRWEKRVSVGRIWLSQSLLLSAASPPQVLQVFDLLHAPVKCKAWGQLCQISDVQFLLFRQRFNFSYFEHLSDCILPQLPVKPFSEANTGYAIIVRQKKDEQPISVFPAMLLLMVMKLVSSGRPHCQQHSRLWTHYWMPRNSSV